LEEGHGGPHADEHGVWEVTSQQPAVPDQIADGRTLAAHEREMSGVGFTREELTAATAQRYRGTDPGFSNNEIEAQRRERQQKVAPSKDEILAAIRAVKYFALDRATEAENQAVLAAGQGVSDAVRAVKNLFEERGL
jgi:hypothetical protein